MAAPEHETGGSGLSGLTSSKDVPTKVLAKNLNEQKDGRDLWSFTNSGTSSSDWFTAKIISGSADGPYTWVQMDFDPTSLSWASSVPANSGINAYRMPSKDYPAPTVPAGQYVLMRLSPLSAGSVGSTSGSSVKYYEMTPWGGELRYTRKVLQGSYCNNGNITNVYKRERWYARDLCIGPGSTGDAS